MLRLQFHQIICIFQNFARRKDSETRDKNKQNNLLHTMSIIQSHGNSAKINHSTVSHQLPKIYPTNHHQLASKRNTSASDHDHRYAARIDTLQKTD